MERVLQWVRPRGVDSRVFVTTASTASSVIVRAAPGRGSSCSPSRRSAMNLDRHFAMVPRLARSSRATSLIDLSPSAHLKTTLARNAIWRPLRGLAIRRSRAARSSMVSFRISDFGRPVRAIPRLDHGTETLSIVLCYRTLGRARRGVRRPHDVGPRKNWAFSSSTSPLTIRSFVVARRSAPRPKGGRRTQ